VPANIYGHRKKVSRNCELTPEICAPLDNIYTDGPPYARVIRSKTYRGYGKPRIIPKAIYITSYNVIFV